MAIEITSNSIVKVLVRRGTDSERQLTALTEGELGYCIDTQRLFIGDGKLNQIYKQVRVRYNANPEAKLLIDAQKAWIKYRDASWGNG